MAHADVRGARLYYEREGTGDPLLLITGWTISSAVFEPVLDLYAEHFDVHPLRPPRVGPLGRRVPDDDARAGGRRGGAADGPARAAGPRLRAVDGRGGGPGAGASPPRARARASCSAARPRAARSRRGWGRATCSRSPAGRCASAASARPCCSRRAFRREHPERVRELLRHFTAHRSSPAAIGAQTLASAQFASTARLGRLQAPTLVMHGELDRLVPLAAARLLAARIPDAELVVVPGTGHAYALEAPRESLELLLGWLERRSVPPRYPRGSRMWRLTDEQRELREHIRSVVLEQIRPRVREMDENCDYPHDLHETLAREDLMGLALPDEYGGRDASEVSWCAYVEELAKVSGTVSLMAAYVKLVALPILLAGSEEQKRSWLPAAGSAASATAPTRSPSRRVAQIPAALQTRAERRGDVWVLNGHEALHRQRRARPTSTWCSRARATRAPRASARSSSTGDSPGLERRAARDDGHAGVEARRADVRGRRGAGREPARPRGRRLQDRDDDLRPLAPDGGGAGRRRRRRARSTSRSTTRCGARRWASPLLDHQGLQFKLAGMEADIAAARALTFQAATFVDGGRPAHDQARRRWPSSSPPTRRCA